MILIIDTKKETVKIEAGKPTLENIIEEIKKVERWTKYNVQYNDVKLTIEKPHAN